MELRPRCYEDWVEKSLDELGVFIKGKGVSRSQANSGSIPCVRYGEIYTQHNDIIKKFYSFISREVAKEAVQLKTGDILFTCSGETKEEIGKSVAFTANLEAYAGGDIILLRGTSADAAFLGYRLNAKDVVLQKSSAGQGDAVVHINATALGNIQVTLPRDIAEQKAIAAALSDVDALLSSLDALITKKRDMKKAAMQELLTGKTRLPGFNGEWKMFELGKEGELQKENINPQQNPKVFFDEYSMPAFDEGRLPQRVLGETMHSNRTRINGPVLLFNKLNVRQKRVWLVSKTNENSVCSMEFLPYQTSKLDLELLRHILLTDEATGFFESCSTGTSNSQKRITPSAFLEYEVNLPSDLSEQQAIADVLSDMDAELEALEARYAKVKDMKTGMMQELLTGKTRLVSTGEQHG